MLEVVVYDALAKVKDTELKVKDTELKVKDTELKVKDTEFTFRIGIFNISTIIHTGLSVELYNFTIKFDAIIHLMRHSKLLIFE
jgi:hypothetical protein